MRLSEARALAENVLLGVQDSEHEESHANQREREAYERDIAAAIDDAFDVDNYYERVRCDTDPDSIELAHEGGKHYSLTARQRIESSDVDSAQGTWEERTVESRAFQVHGDPDGDASTFLRNLERAVRRLDSDDWKTVRRHGSGSLRKGAGW